MTLLRSSIHSGSSSGISYYVYDALQRFAPDLKRLLESQSIAGCN